MHATWSSSLAGHKTRHALSLQLHGGHKRWHECAPGTAVVASPPTLFPLLFPSLPPSLHPSLASLASIAPWPPFSLPLASFASLRRASCLRPFLCSPCSLFLSSSLFSLVLSFSLLSFSFVVSVHLSLPLALSLSFCTAKHTCTYNFGDNSPF